MVLLLLVLASLKVVQLFKANWESESALESTRMTMVQADMRIVTKLKSMTRIHKCLAMTSPVASSDEEVVPLLQHREATPEPAVASRVKVIRIRSMEEASSPYLCLNCYFVCLPIRQRRWGWVQSGTRPRSWALCWKININLTMKIMESQKRSFVCLFILKLMVDPS